MNANLRAYLVVTAGYWAFTVTDGAIRMLVLLYFHSLGYSAFEVAMLFVFYELFGVVTNLVGGWLGARIGVNRTMHAGMALQIVALMALTVPDEWLGVAYVMAAQALSGIAKDLNKMSAKTSVKFLVGTGASENSKLFQWVAVLTGSKNALKGAGFFVGAALLDWVGFRMALMVMAGALFLVLCFTVIALQRDLARMKAKARFSQVFSQTPAVNWLSAARFFLFGARDVWFVVGVPVFMVSQLGWSYSQVGAFMASWVIGYGFVQASAPKVLSLKTRDRDQLDDGPGRRAAFGWNLLLVPVPVGIALALNHGVNPGLVLVGGLAVFGLFFAINSAVHSYLILAFSDFDKAAMNVGFYYMANAGGRLAGTVLSGWLYQTHGLSGCLLASSVFLALSASLCLKLPAQPAAPARAIV